jgi:hypothetical protein
MHNGTKFCLNCGSNEMTNFVEQRRGVRQGCSLSPYFFNIFTDDIINYISEGNVRAPITGKMSIRGLLFAGDLTTESCTVNGLQKRTKQ